MDKMSEMSFRPKRSDEVGSIMSETLSKKPQSISNDQYLKQYLHNTSKWRKPRDYLFLSEKKNNHTFDAILKKKFIDENRIIKYEPTYQLEPVKKLDKKLIESTIEESIRKFLLNKNKESNTNANSDDSINREYTEFLSTNIKTDIKKMVDKRHRIVVLTNIIEDKKQTFRLASNCLWDSERDMSFSITQRNNNIIVTVMVYIIYKE